MSDSTYTDEQIADALLKSGGIQSDAARLLRCSRTTIWARAQESELVQAAIDAGLDDLADKSQAVIREAVESSADEKIKVDTSKWVLARLRKGVWSERQEVTGADGGAVNVELTWPTLGPDDA